MAKEQESTLEPTRPLADRMRPRTLAEFVGQQSVIADGTLLHRLIAEDQLHSLILWGPPGSGKTTLAQIIAHHTKALFMPFSAVVAGIKEVRTVMADAQRYQQATGRRTVLFIDEIHRFNRAQQDAFLPYVENGTIILIGATTENPSFEVNAALLSRAKVVMLEPLRINEVITILKCALSDQERGLVGVKADDQTLEFIAHYASGDARAALNTLELAALSQSANEQGERLLSSETIKTVMQRAVLRYDKSGEEHFNLISAFVERANRVLSRDAIADLTRKDDWEAFDRSIDTLVSRLRRKLAVHTDASHLIQTVRGEGYVLACDVKWSGPEER